jgi:ATP-dependent RNA helicase RhlE
MSLASLGLSKALLKAMGVQNFTNPYPIQIQAIPAILKGRDLLGIAQTGSGKTIAYALPVLMNAEGKIGRKNRHINVLVLVPTRELAVQINEVFIQFARSFPEPIKSLAVFGGVSVNPQMIALQNVDILIATPGRLLELVESNAVHLEDVETLVMDEADQLLKPAFKKEMDRIIGLLPVKRQNLLFSATLSEDVNNITQLLLHDPLVIKIEPKPNSIELITQCAYFVTEEKKGPLLRYLIRHKDLNQVLVFTSSIYKADAVADKLRKNGIQAMAIHGKKSQGSRSEALNKFKSGLLRVLVATDLIARGIDIQFLPYVINYELPRSPKDYIHRIGRTGRAESPGEAISLIAPEDQHHFEIIQKKMGKQVTMIESETINLTLFHP